MKKSYFLLSLIIFAFSFNKINAQVCFLPHVDYTTGINPNSVLSADFNNDGNKDLAVVNGGDNNMLVYLGDGTGAFPTPTSYTTTMVPQGMCSGYFNADAFIDIAFTNAGGGAVNVMLNDGLGGFPAVVSNYGGMNPQSCTSGDFNGDGFIDLVGANYGSGNISLFLGDGAGLFGTSTNFTAGTSPKAVVCADLNGDGFKDVVTANYGSNNISVLIGTGTGSFAARVNYTTSSVAPGCLVSVDVDMDGDKDIVVSNMNSSTISVLLNNGSGVFGAATTFNAGANSLASITTEDFNLDGFADVAVNTDMMNGANILFGNGLGSFSAPLSFASDFGPRSLCSGDFNNDGKADIATTNFNSTSMSVLLSTPLPVVQASASDTTVCQSSSVTLNGLGATTYTWSPFYPNGVAFVPTATVTYTVTGTINGCTDTDTLTVHLLSQPTVNAGPPTVNVCMGGDATLTATGNAASYTWDNGVSNGVPFTPATTMPYIVVGTAANGCTKTASVTVNVNPLPIAVIATSPDSVCSGANYVFSSSGSSGGTIYTWRGPTAGAPAGTTPNSATTGISLSGTYTLTVRNGSTNCQDTATRSITFLALPTVTANATSTLICGGAQVALTGSGADTYTWTGGVTDNVPFNLGVAQTYTVTGTDTNGCSKTATVSISIYSSPTPQICMVTVDDPGNNNVIFWDKASYQGADTFFVYRETSNNVYQIIGKVPFDSLSQFVDTVRTQYFPSTGNPRVGSYKYKISIKDTCGNESPKSLFHKTMFLQDQLNGNFNWSHYEIEGQSVPVSNLTNYLFLRDNDYNGVFETTIGSTTSDLATDPQYGLHQSTADWRIETQWSISCEATLRNANGGKKDEAQTVIVKSKSNIKNNRTIGLANSLEENVNLKVYPNPTKDVLNVELLLTGQSQGKIVIENALGQVVYEVKTSITYNSIDVSQLSAGMYFVKLKTTTGNAVEKIIIE